MKGKLINMKETLRDDQKEIPGDSKADCRQAIARRANNKYVLWGYEENDPKKPTYRVYFDGTKLVREYWDIQNGKYADMYPEKLAKFDRLVLFDANKTDSPALWAIPILTLKTLELKNGNLDVNGSFRCWLPNSTGNSQQFEFTICYKDNQLKFDKLEFKDLGMEEDVPIGVLKGKEFIKEEEGGFILPVIAEKIGLIRTGKETDYSCVRTLTFKGIPDSSKKSSSSSSELVKMSFTMQIPLMTTAVGSPDINPCLKLLPFPIEFQAPKIFQKLYRYSAAPYYMLLTVRQPEGESWEEPFGDHWIFEAQFPQDCALELWTDKVVMPVIDSLHIVRDGHPISFLPKFITLKDKHPLWQARYSIIDKTRGAKLIGDEIPIDIKLPSQGTVGGRVTIVPRILTPDSTSLVETELPAYQASHQDENRNGKGLCGRFSLLPQIESSEADFAQLQNNAGIPGFLFRIKQALPEIVDDKDSSPQLIRMGALDLEFLPATIKSDTAFLPPEEGCLRAVFKQESSKDLEKIDLSTISQREISYSLKLLKIRPGGEDDIPGEEYIVDLGETISSEEGYRASFRRGNAILIDPNKNIKSDIGSNESPYFITVDEKITPGKSQSITLRLRSTQSQFDPSGTDIIRVDTHPFFIARVHVPTIEGGLSAGLTDEIGNWTNRGDVGGGWELNVGANGFELILPPQGMGETMHRRKDAGDFEDNKPASFRFTPPTIVNLQPSFRPPDLISRQQNKKQELSYDN